MQVRLVLGLFTSVCVAGGAWLASEPVAAQGATAARRPSAIPRMSDGRPDLQGTFDVATITPLERPVELGRRLTLTAAEAAALEQYEEQRNEKSAEPSSADRTAPPVGGETSTPKSYLEILFQCGRRGCRRLQQLLARRRHEGRHGRRPEAHVDHRRSAGRPDSTDEARGAASGTPRSGHAPSSPSAAEGANRRSRRRLRRPRAAAARRTVPARIRLDLGSADAAQLLLQQPETDRADAGHDPDPHRDGARRAHHPDERHASAGDSPPLDGRLDRPVGRRYARRRHDQLHRQDAVPRRQPRTCTSSSASPASTPDTMLYRFTVEDPNTWERPGAASTPGARRADNIYEYACHEGNHALRQRAERRTLQREAGPLTGDRR